MNHDHKSCCYPSSCMCVCVMIIQLLHISLDPDTYHARNGTRVPSIHALFSFFFSFSSVINTRWHRRYHGRSLYGIISVIRPRHASLAAIQTSMRDKEMGTFGCTLCIMLSSFRFMSPPSFKAIDPRR